MATKGNPVVQVRVPPDERQKWAAAAASAGLSLPEFVRHVVNERVIGGIVVTRPAASTRSVRWCSRKAFHRPGVYCKECGTTPASR